MKLPLVDEIRAARAQAEECSRAGLFVTRVNAALMSVDILEQQLQHHPGLQVPCPGDEVVQGLGAGWPQLADLAASSLRVSEPLALQLTARRAQLHLALQILRPLSRGATDASHQLHHLQVAQREQLVAPEWEQELAELQELGSERDRLVRELEPVQQRLGMVDPAQRTLQTFMERLESELKVCRRQEDPEGLVVWRTAYLVKQILMGLEHVLDRVHLELPLPETPEVPERPGEVPPETLWAAIEGSHERLLELGEILGAEAKALHVEHDARKEAHDRVIEMIVERMG